MPTEGGEGRGHIVAAARTASFIYVLCTGASVNQCRKHCRTQRNCHITNGLLRFHRLLVTELVYILSPFRRLQYRLYRLVLPLQFPLFHYISPVSLQIVLARYVYLPYLYCSVVR